MNPLDIVEAKFVKRVKVNSVNMAIEKPVSKVMAYLVNRAIFNSESIVEVNPVKRVVANPVNKAIVNPVSKVRSKSSQKIRNESCENNHNLMDLVNRAA